uniref:C-type lectin domain-containing protein n=1 Tax=Timema poppense TaxID=170557 RepID=A0A7R9H1K7_TIMPO|nr:unnamed protein product [Timema poppensis]
MKKEKYLSFSIITHKPALFTKCSPCNHTHSEYSQEALYPSNKVIGPHQSGQETLHAPVAVIGSRPSGQESSGTVVDTRDCQDDVTGPERKPPDWLEDMSAISESAEKNIWEKNAIDPVATTFQDNSSKSLCRRNELFHPCKTTCQKFCDLESRSLKMIDDCTGKCVPGCICKMGFVRPPTDAPFADCITVNTCYSRRLYLEEVYSRLHGWRVENNYGINTLSTPDRDSNLDLPVTGRLVYCESSILGHVATVACEFLSTRVLPPMTPSQIAVVIPNPHLQSQASIIIPTTEWLVMIFRNERIDFYFLLDAKNWTNAVDNCAIKNGFLAIITNIDEFNTTLDLFADNYSYVYDSANLSYAMVGFYRLDGQYVNVKGDPMLSTFYNRWAEGEPSVSGDCGAMDIDGGLHLVPCDHKYGFICEYITI